VIGLLAPMKVELKPLVKRLSLTSSDVGGRTAWTGAVDGKDVVATLAGVGMTPATAATEYLIDRFNPSLVVLSGIAGGIDAGLSVGDLVVPEVVIDYATGTEYRSTAVVGSTATAGRLITTDGLIDQPLLLEENKKGVIAVDMETAAMAAVCERRGVPWVAFRGISDLTHEGLVNDDTMTLVNTDGSADMVGALKLVARQPSVIPKLIKLGKDTTLATNVAAKGAIAACRAWAG
jgi:adenosylhomocysteine nucleosidase